MARISMAVLVMVTYLATTAGWIWLAFSQWGAWLAGVTGTPLLISLILMLRRRPTTYFYSALLLMPYLATAISQLLISTVGRAGAIWCLATGLIYLALLPLALRALNRKV